MGRLLPLAFLVALSLFGYGCDRPSRADTAAQTRPAAVVPKPPEKLLLLDEDEPSPASTRPAADNSRCHVCHLNFAQEYLSTTHAKANVGCAKCHGASDAHIADESWASGGNGTAPEIMFPRDKINVGCMECHKEKLDREVHKAFLAGTAEQKYCTECHGKHRMVNRKCKWK